MANTQDILSTKSLTRRFGGLTVVNELDICIQPGEIVGLIGPNGAGKTTLFNLLVGLIKPSSGEIYFEGKNLRNFATHERCKMGLVKTFQNVALFSDMSVIENVLTGALQKMSLHQAREFAYENLEKVGLSHIALKNAGDLTFPEKALVELARTLCTCPKVILLDEVMAALNELEMDHILDLIQKLRNTEGLTFVVIEHHMRAIMNLCERIVVINFGKKIAEGTPAFINQHPEVVAAYLGHDS
jgi:branched-chain amino acid transport system ATP-binding protein